MSQDETSQDIEKNTQETIEKYQNDLELAEKDETGFVLLDLVCEYLALVTKDSKQQSQEEIKENEEQENVNIWQSFKNSASKIGEFATDFVQNLQKARLSKKLKKEVADVCKEYKKLLEATTMNLQKYRHDIEGIEGAITGIINTLIPRRLVFKKLRKKIIEKQQNETSKNNESDDDIEEIIDEFVEKNKEKLKTKLEILSDLMKKNSNFNKLMSDAKKWSNLATKIEKVIEEISKEQKRFKIFMTCLAITAGVIVTAAITAATWGAAAPLGIALGVTTKTAVAMIVGTGIVVCGTAIGTILLSDLPKVVKNLYKTRTETINAVSNGLKRISEQNINMETILNKVHKQWLETIKHDFKLSYKDFKDEVMEDDGLLKQLYQTKTKLSELKTSIKETEDVCDKELDGYTEKIYRPLLDLY